MAETLLSIISMLGVVAAGMSIFIGFLEETKSFLKVSIPVAVVGIALMIIVLNTTPTVEAKETAVLAVENIGYCLKNDDGSLTPVTNTIFEVDNRETATLVTTTYNHQFLCFKYVRTEKHLEIPRK